MWCFYTFPTYRKPCFSGANPTVCECFRLILRGVARNSNPQIHVLPILSNILGLSPGSFAGTIVNFRSTKKPMTMQLDLLAIFVDFQIKFDLIFVISHAHFGASAHLTGVADFVQCAFARIGCSKWFLASSYTVKMFALRTLTSTKRPIVIQLFHNNATPFARLITRFRKVCKSKVVGSSGHRNFAEPNCKLCLGWSQSWYFFPSRAFCSLLPYICSFIWRTTAD